MENNYISINSIMRFSFLKKFRPFHIVSTVFFGLLNAGGLRGLFNGDSGNMLDPVSLSYGFTLLFVIVWGLVSICIIIPYALHKSTVTDEEILQTGTVNKIISIWFSINIYVILQTLIFVICDMLSSYFNKTIIEHLHTGLMMCVGAFAWLIICACIYFLSQSVRWYFIGFITLNFAPIIIVKGCYDIYNSNPLVNYVDLNPLNWNLFAVSGVSLAYPIVLLSVLIVIIAAFVILKFKVKKPLQINFDKAATVYKSILIFLISLSCGFVVSNLVVSDVKVTFGYVLSFVTVTLGVVAVFTYFSFRNNKPILHTCINLSAMVVSLALILTLIPVKAQKQACTLPDVEDIASITIFLDSIETFEIDGRFDECLELHNELLQLFKDHLPDEVDEPYVEPKCVVEMWNNVNFTYKLKNGETLHREYKYLNDSVFDEFYIKLLQSDLYAYSLQNTQMKKPSMRYYGSTNGYCELPASSVNELLSTYCDELQNADTSAFYEEYETIRFNDNDPYEYGNRIIYIPISFVKTRDLAKTYIDMYSIR